MTNSNTSKLLGISRMALSLMDEHGLIADGWTFEWSHARQQVGSANAKRKVLRLSRPLAEAWGTEGMRETVLHEIAHAKAGHAAGHGPKWRAMCAQVGAKPERCWQETDETPLLPGKFTGTCPNGHTFSRQRVTDRTPETSCPKCAPRFDRRYLITWTRNAS